MRKEKLSFHRFITYIYLPLVIALNIYIAIGNVFPLRRVNLLSLETIALLLPYFTVILYSVSLVELLGKGRKMILFSVVFRTVLELPLIIGELIEGGIKTAFFYAVNVAVNVAIFIYYRKSVSLVSSKTEPLEEKKEPPKVKEIKEEEPLAFKSIGRDFSTQGLVRKTKYFYDTPDTVKLLEATLNIFEDRTIIEMTIENTSGNIYTSSTWKLGDTLFTSDSIITGGKTMIVVLANRPLEKLTIEKVEVR